MTLIEAIKQNNQAEFFRLLNLKTDSLGKRIIDEVDVEYGGGSLYWAADYGYVHFIDPLIRAGADINKSNKYNGTPIYAAAQQGHVRAITALKAAGANMNLLDTHGKTPAYIAAEGGHAAAITALHAAGADMNNPSENGGWTPACYAARNGHAAAIVALHAAGANMNMPEKYGKTTPAYIAAWGGHAAAIVALHAAGANMNMPDKDGKTPVYIAAERDHAAAITALCAAGVNMNMPDKDGKTPAYIAAWGGHAAAIVALHAAGANMNMPDKDGKTPVYIAAERDHAAAITALCAAGVNMNTPDRYGRTPRDIAVARGNAIVLAVLNAADTNMNRSDAGDKEVQADLSVQCKDLFSTPKTDNSDKTQLEPLVSYPEVVQEAIQASSSSRLSPGLYFSVIPFLKERLLTLTDIAFSNQEHYTLENMQKPSATSALFDSWHLDPGIELHADGTPIFKYRFFKYAQEVGFMQLYKHPLPCRSENGARHNILELGGVLSNQAVDPSQLQEVCVSLPPTQFEQFVSQASGSAQHGCTRGIASTVGYALEETGYSEKTAHFVKEATYYSGLFMLSFYNDYVQHEEPVTAAYQAAVNTSTLLFSNTLVQKTCHWASYLSQKASNVGWDTTAQVLGAVSDYAGYARYAYGACSQGVSEMTTQMVVGSAVEKISEKVGTTAVDGVLFAYQALRRGQSNGVRANERNALKYPGGIRAFS